jgi:hypothetical protein
MLMFRPVADLVIDLLTGQPLLSRSPNLFAKTLRAELASIEGQYAELSMTREVCGILERVALGLCAEGAILNPQDCRAEVFDRFFDGFVRVDLLERARSATMKHYDIKSDALGRFEQRVLQQARPFGTAIMESVYSSPTGTPSSKWKNPEPKLSHTSEALHNEVLAEI